MCLQVSRLHLNLSPTKTSTFALTQTVDSINYIATIFSSKDRNMGPLLEKTKFSLSVRVVFYLLHGCRFTVKCIEFTGQRDSWLLLLLFVASHMELEVLCYTNRISSGAHKMVRSSWVKQTILEHTKNSKRKMFKLTQRIQGAIIFDQ